MHDAPQAASAAVANGAVARTRWNPPAADFDTLRAGAVACALPDLAVLELEGPDALAFLHAQSTADIAAMTPAHWQLAAHCTAKGRVVAIFSAWRWEGGLRLLLPACVAGDFCKRLARFVLRSKVRIRDATPDWQIFGVLGAGAGKTLEKAGYALPAAAGQRTIATEGSSCARLHSGAHCSERLLIVAPASATVPVAELPRVDAGVWWWSQIDAGIAEVFDTTQELFVPQSLNLEVLGAVSFKKGCYPGQEVVARSQYLGKLRRRTHLAHATAIGPDPDLYQDGAAQAVGRIVLASRAPGGGWDLLVECPVQGADTPSLHAGAADAPALALDTLPYPIFDPTAK